MPSTWPFCPVTPIHRPSELAESTGRGPRGQEHRIRMQTLGPRAPGPGSQAQGQRLQQHPQGRHVGWGPRPRLSVPGLGWHQARSSDSQVAMADTLFSEMGLGPATKGATRPAGEGGLAGGGGISRALQESSCSGDPQVRMRPACSPKAVTHLPSLTWAGQSRAQGLASAQGWRDGRGGAGRPL